MKNGKDDMLLTIRDVCAIASVTQMTVYNWRQQRTDKSKLSTVRVTKGKRGKRLHVPGVRFKEDQFLAWAQKNGVGIDARALKRVKAERRAEG